MDKGLEGFCFPAWIKVAFGILSFWRLSKAAQICSHIDADDLHDLPDFRRFDIFNFNRIYICLYLSILEITFKFLFLFCFFFPRAMKILFLFLPA